MRLSRGGGVALIALILAVASGCTDNSPVASTVILVPASADSELQDGHIQAPAPELRVGRAGSAALVSYLTFPVAAMPSGDAPLRATVILTRQDSIAGLVELTTLSDVNWTTTRTAPMLGEVLATRRLAANDTVVSFDVTSAVTGPGTYAFALTSPDPALRFRGSRATSGGPELRLDHAAPDTRVRKTSEPPTTDVEATAPPAHPGPACDLGRKLIPRCGVLTGVAAAAHTGQPRDAAFREFERTSGRDQRIYHAYHRGTELFPTPAEIALAHEPGHPRILFLNWKPRGVTWARIAAGDYDPTIDRLAAHMVASFTDPMFFTVHHEPENDVDPAEGSGVTAKDYAAMYRHVIERLHADGVHNLITVMSYMSYIPWNTQPWFGDLYPGDDIIDWIGWDVYANSDPGYGYGDFAEMINRTSTRATWPGFYTWAATTHPTKALMISEWGVWQSATNPDHKPWLYRTAAQQLTLFPRIKALLYFDSPTAEGRDSRTMTTPQAQDAYRELMTNPAFDTR